MSTFDSDNAPPPRSTPRATATRHDAPVVLDVRDGAAFRAGHLPGAAHLTPAEFESRRAELPPREVRVVVAHDDPEQARVAATVLAEMGYVATTWLERPLAELPDGHASTAPPVRMWRPSPFLERVLPHLPVGRSLDLACGSGRELVWMAKHGWEAHGWDRAAEALERARGLAEREGVHVHTRVLDLERPELPFAEPLWNVVTVFRFLHRPILPWIERLLAPGGALVCETYRVGQERFGRPKHPRFLLEPGELLTAFPSCTVEIHEESTPEHGPIMSRLLARKTGA